MAFALAGCGSSALLLQSGDGGSGDATGGGNTDAGGGSSSGGSSGGSGSGGGADGGGAVDSGCAHICCDPPPQGRGYPSFQCVEAGATCILPDSACERDAGGTDSGAGGDDSGGFVDGACFTTPVPAIGVSSPPWATGNCPQLPATCPVGTFCLWGQGEGSNMYGCVPIPAACGTNPSCDCMGCVCAYGCIQNPMLGPVVCFNGTISRRAFKDDVAYVTDEEREALARQALDIPLARYRYKNEPTDARRRLGFLIDDQPDPSPAVDGDRTHVDEYGYTSMLLATVQQQAREIDELRRRVETLERGGETRSSYTTRRSR
jgi:hypothetical protein